MADPRFYDNRGPFTLAGICQRAGVGLPSGADGAMAVADLAGLEGAGPQHLTFYSGNRDLAQAFAASRAGVCLAPKGTSAQPPKDAVLIEVKSVAHAFADVAAMFYPDASQPQWAQKELISPSARGWRS